MPEGEGFAGFGLDVVFCGELVVIVGGVRGGLIVVLLDREGRDGDRLVKGGFCVCEGDGAIVVINDGDGAPAVFDVEGLL